MFLDQKKNFALSGYVALDWMCVIGVDSNREKWSFHNGTRICSTFSDGS